jgi:hypothetical protein
VFREQQNDIFPRDEVLGEVHGRVGHSAIHHEAIPTTVQPKRSRVARQSILRAELHEEAICRAEILK